MTLTRRHALGAGLSAFALGATGLHLPRALAAGDSYVARDGEIVIHPVAHASFVIETPGRVIYVDPVGDPALYADLPAPELVLITHEHGDHYDPDTLAALIGGTETPMITNPEVFAMLPSALLPLAQDMANGDEVAVDAMSITAVPAYNTTEDRLQYHPQGRDNGYLLDVAGRRIYIAGDTEDIPEMRALTGIDIAFVPMNLPYTMTEEQAASAVIEFAPAVVYPYHSRGSDVAEFARLVKEGNVGTEVVIGAWYPES